jgi:predicted RNA binding protein YcfA (HicA-like mRNA interferase family)
VPKIPGISQRDAVRIFEKLGYHIARQSGHIVMTNGKQRLIIPRHNPTNAIHGFDCQKCRTDAG